MTRSLFEDMNSRIFEDKLPHDLEIRWNARLNTTAGITVSVYPPIYLHAHTQTHTHTLTFFLAPLRSPRASAGTPP